MKDEFAFISNISPEKTHQSSLLKGIGDDAAVYRGSSQFDEVVCVDTMVEGIHFRKDTLTPLQIGKKGLAVNVSDLAAMGAIPLFYLVSVAVSPSWNEQELREIYAGMEDLAKEYQMDLIGGDTVSTGDALVLTVTVIGRVEQGCARYRHTAQVGDTVFVTGTVGGSAAGLELLLQQGLNGDFTGEEQSLLLAHQEPMPHVVAGRLLANYSARISLNDISDGLASEANELAEASGVQLMIESDKIPFHPAIAQIPHQKQLEYALFGGEDFALIGTVPSEQSDSLAKMFSEKGLFFKEIGSVLEGPVGVFLKDEHQQRKLEKQGYNHFQKRG
ncbi:thiamine-phosphate kinase [Bacillus suaedae]|uniref:Thiamine-monophosphate kinase n=1 Tax=Halalkalibacter suaedae TaxID=2822140 RepID=A0A940X1C8_9BACI|nr:thiamine-phosphate kinase [Bacillus suaedae]MBP3952989.1 thiamine-phosphate kinase [Bacillus suaedae]